MNTAPPFPRWLHLSIGLWHAVVLEAGCPPRRGVVKRGTRNVQHVQAFLNSLRWRMSSRITEKEFTSAFLAWQNVEMATKQSSLDSTRNNTDTLCSLHAFRELLVGAGLTSADLSLMLGLIVNERNRLELKVNSKPGVNAVALASRLQLVQKLFFCLDGTGGGTLGLDDMLCLCLCEWSTGTSKGPTGSHHRSSMELFEEASIILRSLGASTTSPGLASATMAQFQLGVSDQSTEDLGITLRNLNSFWKGAIEKHLNTDKDVSIQTPQWHAVWDMNEKDQLKDDDSLTSWTDTPLPQVWKAANKLELREKVNFISSNIGDVMNRNREIDRSFLVSSFLELYGPPCRLVSYFSVASDVGHGIDSSLRSQWGTAVATSLCEQYETLARSGGLMQLFQQCGGVYNDVTARLRQFSNSWQPSKGELKQIERVVTRAGLLLQETVAILTTYAVNPRTQTSNETIDDSLHQDAVHSVSQDEKQFGDLHEKCEGVPITREVAQLNRVTEIDSNVSTQHLPDSSVHSGGLPKPIQRTLPQPETSPITSSAKAGVDRRKKKTMEVNRELSNDSSSQIQDNNKIFNNQNEQTSTQQKVMSSIEISQTVQPDDGMEQPCSQENQVEMRNKPVSSPLRQSVTMQELKPEGHEKTIAKLTPSPVSYVNSQKLSPNKVSAVAFELFRRHEATFLLMNEITKLVKPDAIATNNTKTNRKASTQKRIAVDWDMFERNIDHVWYNSDLNKSPYMSLALSNLISDVQSDESEDPNDVANDLDRRLADPELSWLNGTAYCKVTGDLFQCDFECKHELDLKHITWDSITLDDVVSDVIKREEEHTRLGVSSPRCDNHGSELLGRGRRDQQTRWYSVVYPPGLKTVAALSLFLNRQYELPLDDPCCKLIVEGLIHPWIVSGFLHKKGTKLRRGWKRKFFFVGVSPSELHGRASKSHSLSLYYYKTTSGGKVSGTLREYSLVDGTVSIANLSPASKAQKQQERLKGKFTLTTPESEVTLSTETIAERDKWVSCLRFACAVQAELVRFKPNAMSASAESAISINTLIEGVTIPPVDTPTYNTSGAIQHTSYMQYTDENEHDAKDQHRNKQADVNHQFEQVDSDGSSDHSKNAAGLRNPSMDESLPHQVKPAPSVLIEPSSAANLGPVSTQGSVHHNDGHDTNLSSGIDSKHIRAPDKPQLQISTEFRPRSESANLAVAHSMLSANAQPERSRTYSESQLPVVRNSIRANSHREDQGELGKQLKELASVAENLRIFAESRRYNNINSDASSGLQQPRYHHRVQSRKPTSPTITIRNETRHRSGSRKEPLRHHRDQVEQLKPVQNDPISRQRHRGGRQQPGWQGLGSRKETHDRFRGEEEETGLWNLQLNFARHELRDPVYKDSRKR